MNKSLLCLILLAGTVGMSYLLFAQDSDTPEASKETPAMVAQEPALPTTYIQAPEESTMSESTEMTLPTEKAGNLEMVPEVKEEAGAEMPALTEPEKITPVMPTQEEEIMPKKPAVTPTITTPAAPQEGMPEMPTTEEPVVNLPAVTTVTEPDEKEPVLTPAPAETPEMPMAEDNDRE